MRRNQLILEAYSKSTALQVAEQFGISVRRIHSILVHVKARHRVFKPNLSMRAWHVLLRAGIKSEAELAAIEKAKLSNLRIVLGCGPLVFDELVRYRDELIYGNRANDRT